MTDSAQPPFGDPPPPPTQPPTVPGYGPSQGGGAAGPLPWVERDRLGIAEALIETIKLFLTDPKGAYGRVRADGDYVSPFLFALGLGWVMAVVGQIWGLLWSSMFPFGLGMSNLQGLEALGRVTVGSALTFLLIYPFFLTVRLFIIAGVCHLGLMLMGALDASETRFEGSFKVLCYAQVASLANIIPLVGGLLAMVASLVLMAIGFEQVHRAGTAQAVIEALLPLLLCCLCAAAFGILFGATLVAAVAGAGVS